MAPNDNNAMYAKLFYTPREFPFRDIMARRKYRNVLSTAECDAGIIVSGRWGTMNEFTNLHDMGKVIGVLLGTGGIADALADWNNLIKKPSKAILIYESDPKKLLDTMKQELDRRAT